MADAAQINGIQRQRLLDQLHGTLQRATPNVSEKLLSQPAGDPAFFDRYLDGLLDIARRSTASQMECYLSQILDRICSCCAYQQHSGFCPLRHAGICPLYCYAAPVLEALRSSLEEMASQPVTEPETECTCPSP